MTNYALAKCASTVCRLLCVAFVSNLNAESIIDTWNVPAKTKMESYDIIDFQLMGGLSEHKNGSPGGSMSEVVGSPIYTSNMCIHIIRSNRVSKL